MATHARQQYFADESSLSKEKREFSIADGVQQKIDSIEEGAQVNTIETIKVNGAEVQPDVNKAVNLAIPGVVDSLDSISSTNALSARQGKVLYDYIQDVSHIGHFLALWDASTGLPVTNPETSPYIYNTGDFYTVSNVAPSGGTNYRPDGTQYVIGQASTTVDTDNVAVNDFYFYDGTTWRHMKNSGAGSIAVDGSLSTTSTNPVENRVITNAINGKQNTLIAGTNIQIAADGKTISATDTTYSAGANISIDANNEISAVDTKYTAGTNVQISNQNVISATDTKYTAGTGINIDANNVISNTQTSAEWGNITGTLSDQTDLQTALDAKQDDMVILSYGNSTWSDFITAYQKNGVVYCRASSNSDPSTGSQGRLAFMAYVNNASNPTEVEFQYYRSRSSHGTSANVLDEVYVYKLVPSGGGTWSVTQRDIAAKPIAGTGIGLTYNASGMTISADTTVLATKTDLNSKQDTLVSGTNIKTINGNSLLGSGNITIDESSIKVFTVTDLDDSSQCYEVYSRVRDGEPAIVIYGSHVFYYTGTYTNLGETKYYFHTLYGYGETIFELILEANAQLYRWDNPTEVNLGGDKIEYVTQAEYNALPSSKLTDNKHYFIYSTSGGGGWQPGVNTIAYYPLESDVKDYSGNNNDGTNNGVTFSNVGGVDCAVFTSASTKIILPGLGSFTNLTMSVWFKTTASYNGSTILMLAPSTDNKNIDLSIESGTARLSRYTGTSYNITDGIVNDGVWHHMVGTYTSTGGTKLYVDGVFINSDSATTQVKSDSGFSAIGGHPGGYSWATFDGNISNVIIETAEWSAQDVSNYYNLTKGDYGIS